MIYEQSLVKTIEPVKKTTISRLNKGKKWKYGYDKEHDIIVISKTGEIGEIYEIQNLKIALPLEENTVKFKSNKWEYTPLPKELSRIKTIFDWEEYPLDFNEEWYDYIDEEFKKGKLEEVGKGIDEMNYGLSQIEKEIQKYCHRPKHGISNNKQISDTLPLNI